MRVLHLLKQKCERKLNLVTYNVLRLGKRPKKSGIGPSMVLFCKSLQFKIIFLSNIYKKVIGQSFQLKYRICETLTATSDIVGSVWYEGKKEKKIKLRKLINKFVLKLI
jgi:hypothetical protein